jgi:hypothetical protein
MTAEYDVFIVGAQLCAPTMNNHEKIRAVRIFLSFILSLLLSILFL